MNDTAFVCKKDTFSSYLAEQMTSFVEYKVNVNGCVPESFIPPLKLLDDYCLKHPKDSVCLTKGIVTGFFQESNTKSATLKRKTSIIRSFATYLALVLEIEDVYIPGRTAGHIGKTFIPYVFNKAEIVKLLKAAHEYTPKQMNKPTVNLLNSIICIITMLYCTGMRVNEACSLSVHDVDFENEIIHINHAKNDNRRIVTMSSSLVAECKRYLEESEHYNLSGKYFFDSGSSLHCGKVHPKVVYKYFRLFIKNAGIQHKGAGFGPRLHDLRVTFAVHSLERLTRENDDVNACLYYLTVYMGHQSIRETQDYLWLTKEVFKPTLERLEKYESYTSEIYNEKVGDLDD